MADKLIDVTVTVSIPHDKCQSLKTHNPPCNFLIDCSTVGHYCLLFDKVLEAKKEDDDHYVCKADVCMTLSSTNH